MTSPRERRRADPGAKAAQSPPSRRYLLGLAAIVVVSAALVWKSGLLHSGRTPAPAHARNILLITLDTTRADYLGCYGRSSARTPNLDRLAREGALFTRCTSCSPTTLPSHASILTGVYPYVHNARLNGSGKLPDGNTTLAEALKAAGFATQATIASFVLNRQFGIAQGFDVYHEVVPAAGAKVLNAERRGPEVCEDALRMLDTLADKPFFLWVHFYDPHWPYLSPRYPDPDSPQAYEDEIALMDAQIGRLLEKLQALGRERDTLVVAVGDHGEGLGQHGELTHGYFLYDSTIHVPLIVRCPGVVPAGVTVKSQVRTTDIAPTILDLLGQPPLESAEGVSLAPAMEDPDADLKRSAYSEALTPQAEYGLAALRSLSTGGWKYIHAPQAELYYLVSDVGESRNLAGTEKELTSDLRERLRLLIADAPPPVVDEGSATLSETDVKLLESLGYVAAPQPERAQEETELDRFQPVGGDPKDYAWIFRLMGRELSRLREAGDMVQAESRLREAVAALPEAARLHVQLAECLHQQGRDEEAAREFERAIAVAPDDEDPPRRYGVFLLQAGRYQEAARFFAAALEKHPDQLWVLRDAAEAVAALKEHDQAEELLRRAHEIDPRNATVLRTWGRVKEQREDYPEALKYYNQALEIDPNYQLCQQDRQRVLKILGW